MAVLLCGTNNMQHDEPKDIAEGVIACSSKLVEKDPQLHVFFHLTCLRTYLNSLLMFFLCILTPSINHPRVGWLLYIYS